MAAARVGPASPHLRDVLAMIKLERHLGLANDLVSALARVVLTYVPALKPRRKLQLLGRSINTFRQLD
jgi:hypothetical protein